MLELFEQSEELGFVPSKNFITYTKIVGGEEEKAFLGKLLSGYKLSASHLNRYQECGRAFLFECFLKVKYPPNKAMVRGTIVHSILEWIFNYQKQFKYYPEGKQIRVRLNELWQKEFMKYPNLEFDEDEYRDVEKLVLDYFDTYKFDWNRIVVTEFHVRKAVWNDIPLTGFIDKIEFDGHTVNVVDYKTGNIEYALKSAEQGGNYWNQLFFYAVLLEIQKPQWEVESVEMCMISQNEDGNYVNKKLAVREEDKAKLKEHIVSTYDNIRSFNFEGCKKKDCFWCQQSF